MKIINEIIQEIKEIFLMGFVNPIYWLALAVGFLSFLALTSIIGLTIFNILKGGRRNR
jgi:ABC-type antimicrobial peptide transport system permease subunit